MDLPSSYKLSTNLDLSTTILGLLNIEDAKNYIKYLEIYLHMDKNTLRYLRRRRLTPIPLLSKLVDTPETLLSIMTRNKILLSGSRVVSFMYPTFLAENSDWDFYCSYDIFSHRVNIESSIKDNYTNILNYFSLQGAVWTNPKHYDPTESTRYSNIENMILRACVLKKGNKVHKIQFICCRSVPYSAFSNIINFHSSVAQCFITGFSVVSMYHSLTSIGLMLRWDTATKVYKEMYGEARAIFMRCGVHKLLYRYRPDELVTRKINELRMAYKNKLSEYSNLYPDRNNVEVLKNEQVYSLAQTLKDMLHSMDTKYRGLSTDKFYYLITGTCNCKGQTPAELGVKKYIERGFKLIQFRDYLSFINEKDVAKYYIRARNLKDTSVYTDCFIEHLNMEDEDITYKLFNKSLYSTWYEFGIDRHRALMGTSSTQDIYSKSRMFDERIPVGMLTLGDI